MKQLLLELQPDTPPCFDNYIIGNNAHLVHTLQQSTTPSNQNVYLWGEHGSGRSHLLKATEQYLQQNGRTVVLLQANQIKKKLPSDMGVVILIDDIEKLSGQAQLALFSTFNHCQNYQQQIIASGTCPPQTLPLREDLRSRIGQGLIFKIQPFDDDMLEKIMATLAQRQRLPLSREVVQFMLRHQRRDLPSLLHLMAQLSQTTLEQKCLITVPLIKKLLSANATGHDESASS